VKEAQWCACIQSVAIDNTCELLKFKKGNKHMKFNAIRAWKDENYRLSLSDEELAQLPESPVGDLELSDADLASVQGGWDGGDGGHGHGGLNIFSVVICHSLVVVGDC